MNFFHTYIDPSALTLVAETLQSGLISEGKRVRDFEEELACTLGIIRPVAVNSGTSALHLALTTAGVGPGDEVILPAQTFIASGLTVLMCGARPVFVDIQSRTGNIDPISLRAKITDRTKAIMPVHWAGYPCDMDEINAIAGQFGLAVIEDAAHALGAIYKGRPIGAISRFTAFSFQAIKHLTTGDGGALCCFSEIDFRTARRNRWFGIDREDHLPSILGERVYDLSSIGFKYHLNDVGAALGLGNLGTISERLERHRGIAALYRSALENIPGLTLLEASTDRKSSFWLFTILVEQREAFIRALKARGVPASVVHQRIDRNSIFGMQDLPNQAFFDGNQVSLPVHVGLTDEDVAAVIAAVQSGW